MVSILDLIPKLDSMPERVKDSDGMFYPENIRNKIFRYGTEVMYIKKSVIESIPSLLIDKISELIIKHITDNINSIIESQLNLKQDIFADINTKLEAFETVQTSVNFMDEVLSTHSENIESLNTVIENIKSEIKEIKEIPNIVDQKMTDLHNNYKPVLEQIIDDKISKIETLIASMKPKQTENEKSKLSMKELFAMSELYGAEDLVKLRQSGII